MITFSEWLEAWDTSSVGSLRNPHEKAQRGSSASLSKPDARFDFSTAIPSGGPLAYSGYIERGLKQGYITRQMMKTYASAILGDIARSPDQQMATHGKQMFAKWEQLMGQTPQHYWQNNSNQHEKISISGNVISGDTNNAIIKKWAAFLSNVVNMAKQYASIGEKHATANNYSSW